MLADAGAEFDKPSLAEPRPLESKLERLKPVELGVQPSCDVADSRRESVKGRNKSRVRSNISDPIALIATAYRSRLILDSLTIKSANSRTRSASDVHFDSCVANAWNLSTEPVANCSEVCIAASCLERALLADVGGLEVSRGCALVADLTCGGGVGSAFGAPE